MKYLIYKITNNKNGKIYIGYTSKSLKERIDGHIKSSKKINSKIYFHLAIKKYGIENFTKEIIYETTDKIDALNKEVYFISFYKSYQKDIGYNLSMGGEGGNGNFGIPLQPEHKRKISLAHKGKIFNIQHRKNLSNAKKGKYKGSDNSFFGKKHSDETKRKISSRNYLKGKDHPFFGKKIAISFTKDNHPKSIKITVNMIEYISIAEASRQLNLSKDKLQKLRLQLGDNFFYKFTSLAAIGHMNVHKQSRH